MLPVYSEGQLVGQLENEPPGVSFTYARSWLETRESFAISLAMPRRPEAYSPRIATSWFANLLPEDRLLERIGRLLGRDPADVYGLLEEMGRETAGALSIGGPEPIVEAEYRELSEPDLADIIARLPERPMLVGEPEVTMSLAGAQSKLTVAVFDNRVFLPLRGAASTHIIKPQSDRLYATVENELLCMRLAASLGMLVASTAMGRAAGCRYLLVERYDRQIVSARRVARRHQEDFCQALGLYPTQKYEANKGPGLEDLFRTVDRWSRHRARDRLTLLDLLVFACCIGDTDRHGKNYALLLAPGETRLAPGYDFLSALAYEGITRNLAMRVAGSNRAEHLEQRHWERFARAVGLAPAATVARVEHLASMVGERVGIVAAELSNAYDADGAALQLLSERIRGRARTIAANSRRGPPAAADGGDAEDLGPSA